jgi:CheY-like chemotaxis protein
MSEPREAREAGSPPEPRGVVAIFNSNADIMELLRVALESEGLQTVSGHVVDIKRGHLDVIEFVEQHDPRVIIYDVVPPYEPNWTFLRLLRSSEAMRGRRFVLTTTNKAVLEGITDPAEMAGIHELIGKPYDLGEITRAVRSAVEAPSPD